jgi:cellulose synthase/poly-beta-1,6-N-acetylglucosamine synthase-like glycosyltransferase
LHGLLRQVDRLAMPLLVVGLGAVAITQRRAWQRDKALAETLRAGQAAEHALAATPRVTVLVAAWNEMGTIDRHIRSVLGLRYPNLEYVLCAGGGDGTYDRARQYQRPGVVVLAQSPGEGKQAALRRGLANATGQVIYLTDADCVLDDLSFERVIEPVIAGDVDVATGGSRPLPEQIERSALAVHHWASDAYAAASGPELGGGLLGRNAAISRQALDRAGGLRADVPSGTDYHLAKMLLHEGFVIRQVRGSEVQSRYAERLPAYARQQRRWLRNVVLLGLRFGAYQEAALGAKTSLIGLAMLLAPLASLWLGRWVLSAWAVLLVQGTVGKMRYLAFLSRREDRNLASARRMLLALPLTLAELPIWTLPLLDYLRPGRRIQW